MRDIAISVAAMLAIFALGVGPASAMGGGGDLSPEQSPYALLAPITLGAPAMSDGRAAYVNDGLSPATSQPSTSLHGFERRKGTPRRLLARPNRNHPFD